MPNPVAYFALFAFPLVVLFLFRRMDQSKALIWSILLGYLFLPEKTGIDPPLLPTLDKVLIPSMIAGFLLWRHKGPKRQRAMGVVNRSKRMTEEVSDADEGSSGPRPRRRTPESKIRRSLVINGMLIVMLFIIPVGTFLTNPDIVRAGPRVLPAVSIYDIFSMTLSAAVLLLPFLLGRYYLYSLSSQVKLLGAIVISALIYSALMLVEMRFSPQLHNWIYGFHAHQFIQHIRGGEYRPMMFIGHGLRVGIFMACAVLAAMTLYRISRSDESAILTETFRKRLPYGWITLWLFVILYMSRNLGAFMLILLTLPMVYLLGRRLQVLVVFCIAIIVGSYPMLRQADRVPVDRIHAFALTINEQRARSLKGRFDQEDALLVRASQRPFFGWGGWNRSRLFDPITGQDLSVTDGTWVIIFGKSGWIGYLAQFGLLLWPIFLLFWRRKTVALSFASCGLVMMLGINLIDLLPNSGLTPITWLIAGSLLGGVERQSVPDRVPNQQPQRGGSGPPGFSRGRAVSRERVV